MALINCLFKILTHLTTDFRLVTSSRLYKTMQSSKICSFSSADFHTQLTHITNFGQLVLLTERISGLCSIKCKFEDVQSS